MHDCIGLLESRSLARGIEAADAMAKEAPVALLWMRAIEPGKHVALFSGEVDDVRAALRRGRTILREDAIDELFLPAAHPSIFDALSTASSRGERAFFAEGTDDTALGLIECATVAATLLAADAAAKQARVRLIAARVAGGMGGKGLVALTGEVSDVESAVAKGAALAEERAALVRTALIPRPAAGVLEAALNT